MGHLSFSYTEVGCGGRGAQTVLSCLVREAQQVLHRQFSHSVAPAPARLNDRSP